MKKLVKRLVGLALAATMVVGMGVVSFAAGNSGAYSVKYLDANGNETMGAASLVGADLEYVEEDKETIVTVYTQAMEASYNGATVYGWIKEMTIAGVEATVDDTAVIAATGEKYPCAFSVVIAGNQTSTPLTLSADISVYVNGYSHASQGGSLVIQ